MSGLRLVFTLAAKDLRLFFRDKVGMALGFLLPIALVAVFASVFGSFGGDDGGGIPKQTLRIADDDGSDASRKLVATLNDANLAEAITTDRDGTPYTRAVVADLVGKGRAPLAVVLDKGFGAKLEAGEALPIEIIRDPTKDVEFQLASQALLAGLMQSAGPRLGRAMTLKGVRAWRDAGAADSPDKARLDDAAATISEVIGRLSERMTGQMEDAAASQPSAPDSRPEPDGFAGFRGPGSMLGIRETIVGASSQSRADRQRIGRLAQAISGTAVMMLLFGLTACGGTILQERDQGTLRRLLITPAPRGAILGGKFLFTYVMGLLQLAVMFAFGALVFRLPVLPHLAGLLIVSAATCAAATSFGMFIATVTRTQKQVEGISTLVILVMSALGGSWFPLFLAPKWMQVAGHFTLNAWAMDGYMGILAFGRSLSEIMAPVGVLLGIAATLSVLSVVLFRRRFSSAENG